MKVAIVGEGNVGNHLKRALKGATLINSRTLEGLDRGFDIVLLCVSDNAISSVAQKVNEHLPGYQGIVAHTSGSSDMDVLAPYFENFGVFYPLQTFSRDIEIKEYEKIPIFIEANTICNEEKLRSLAETRFTDIFLLSSEKRRKLHLASIFVCNFVNCLYGIGEDLIKEEEIPFEVLIPLIDETARKIEGKSPVESQTGPAKRGDTTTIARHTAILESKPEIKEIYTLLTNYISKHHASACK